MPSFVWFMFFFSFQFLINLDPFLQDFQTFLLLRFDLFRDPLQTVLLFVDPICTGRNCLLAASKAAFTSTNDCIFDLELSPWTCVLFSLWHIRENFPQFVVRLDLLIDLSHGGRDVSTCGETWRERSFDSRFPFSSHFWQVRSLRE